MYIDLPRTDIRLDGSDRASFLHNFCTADIKAMQPGQITEAFILNVKGKLLGHVLVFCHEDRIELNTVPDQSGSLIQHLDRYLIREDVELSEIDHQHVFVFGESHEPAPAVPVNQFEIRDGLRIGNCEAAGRGLLVSGASSDTETFKQTLTSGEATPKDLQLHRIQSGTPWFEIDSDSQTLPQELQRDEQAISFNKGCYLGQETVARIDAIGRVNKLLVRVVSDQPLQAGTTLSQGEKEVGQLSSVETDGEKYFGLATVRRDSSGSGTTLTGPDNSSVVVS